MAEPKVAPYGSWKSPLTLDVILEGAINLGHPMADGDDMYWTEVRPAEGGRSVIVRRTPDGQTSDMTPPALNARTRAHEYGGGEYTVDHRTIYFSNFADGRLYRQQGGGEPRPITPEAAMRYADMVVDRARGRLICVREDHTVEGHEATNTLVAIPLDGDSAGEILVSGNDFYAYPRISPDGSRLAWTTWNHPNLPWDGTELWVADVAPDGSLGERELIAGGVEESIFQPAWSPDGVLHFVSDRTGWWNLYRWVDGGVEPVCPMEAEFGAPQWLFGTSTYAFESGGCIVCRYIENGMTHLATIDTATGKLQAIEMPYVMVAHVGAAPGGALLLVGSATAPTSIVRLDLATGEFETLRRASEQPIEPGYLSVAEPVEFPTEQGLTAHGFFYAPRNQDFTAPAGERPPLMVICHGGPTGATFPILNLGTQYWTSRGIAVLDVNYGGSTGYGRPYRLRLNGQWGIVDVDDCVNGGHYLFERGDVDGNRVVIRGGSAGGYTTLRALTYRNFFRAGASHFGLSDLEAFIRDTHKFESRYLDRLIGPYPEQRDLYRDRSPIYHLDQLRAPLILFQGLDDKIVLPNQAEMMFEAVRAKGIPTAYLAFEGEGHGFRKKENIKRSTEAELYFYGRVFGFELVDAIEPVPIENL